MNATYLIEKLGLKAHPEGGYYKETYRSELTSGNDTERRNLSTAIYFMLEGENKSMFHKIKSDELWFFHQGEAIDIYLIHEGKEKIVALGNNIQDDEVPQAMIPANTWFAAKLKKRSGYGLVSCTVAPGFDFSDFELATREDLLRLYPHLKTVIEIFT